jgi:hypothetical protein
MRSWVFTLVTLALLAPAVPEAAAQNRLASLENDLVVEARMIDGEIADYQRSRAATQEAVARYRQMAAAFDEALDARRDPLEEIRRMSAGLTREGDRVASLLRESATHRTRLLDRAARIHAIYEEMEQVRSSRPASEAALDGLWSVEIDDEKEFGTLELRVTGNLVIGSYRLENGASGSVKGSYSGGILTLDSISSEQGFDYTLQAEVDEEAGEIRGTFLAVQLGQTGRASGTWTARKLSWEGQGR